MQENKQTQKKPQTPPNKSGKAKPKVGPNGKPINKNAMKKRKKKKVSFGGIFSIFLLIVIAGVVGVIYFDLFGSRQILVDVLELGKPTQVQLDELNAKISELATKEEEYNSTIFNLNKREKEVTDKEKELDAKEKELENKESELNTLKNSVVSGKNDLKTMAKMFELMDAKKAAKAIGDMEKVEDIIVLLANMDSEKSALILDNIDTKMATKIMDEVTK